MDPVICLLLGPRLCRMCLEASLRQQVGMFSLIQMVAMDRCILYLLRVLRREVVEVQRRRERRRQEQVEGVRIRDLLQLLPLPNRVELRSWFRAPMS